MNHPKVYDNKPAVVKLEPGEYFWCQCGLSANQPFCDGQHRGTPFSPQRITIKSARRLALCNCKQSRRGYLCDGAHLQID